MADRVLSRCADLHKIGLRSPEETQRTIDFLLAELTRQQDRFDKLNAVNAGLVERVVGLEEALDGLRGCYRDLEDRFELLLATVCSLKAGRLH